MNSSDPSDRRSRSLLLPRRGQKEALRSPAAGESENEAMLLLVLLCREIFHT